MESKFTESFDKIKENFATVFSEMFDGGKGRLDLDVQFGQSVLDAGIIVEAEPPGKKIAEYRLAQRRRKSPYGNSDHLRDHKVEPRAFLYFGRGRRTA